MYWNYRARSGFAILIVAFSLMPSTAIGEYREWTDKTGKFRVQAKAMEVSGDSVELLRRDGKRINVSVDLLSDTDVRYLAEKFPETELDPDGDTNGSTQVATTLPEFRGVTTYSQLKKLANNVRTAGQVVDLHRAFLASATIGSEEKAIAQTNLREWEDLAAKNATRVGRKWLDPQQVEAMLEKEYTTIREAHRLIDVTALQTQVEDKFLEASKANPESIRADFYLGTLYALLYRDSVKAERHFKECVDRCERSTDLLVGSRRTNYVASLNNLALAEVRNGRYDLGIKHWKQALEISPQTPELVQNLGRITQLAGLRRGFSERVGKMAGDLYAAACVANNLGAFDASVGWLYIPYADSVDGTMDAGQDEEIRPVAHATGFAIAPDLVVVPSNAISDANHFRLTVPRSGTTISIDGAVVAVDTNTGIVVLRFQGLNAIPLRLSNGSASRAKEYTLLGVPTPGMGNGMLNAIKTTVVDFQSSPAYHGILIAGLSAVSHLQVGQSRTTVGAVFTATHSIPARRFVLHNKIVEPGFTGAPLVSEDGQVVAIHFGSPRAIINASFDFSAAISSESIYPFIATLEDVARSQHEENADHSVSPLAGLGDASPSFDNSVFQLTGLKASPRLKWSHRISGNHHRLRPTSGWTSFEDRSCGTCNGDQVIRCSDRGCSNGTIRVYRMVKRNENPTTGEPIYSRVAERADCPKCNAGKIKCPHCNNGVDRNLR